MIVEYLSPTSQSSPEDINNARETSDHDDIDTLQAYIDVDDPESLAMEWSPRQCKQEIRSNIRDLKNLAISCKSFYSILQYTLYQRSVQDDWYALRWACFHGSIPTLEAAFAAGAPPNHSFADSLADYHRDNCRCTRYCDGICFFSHQEQPVRSARTPLLTAIRGGQLEAVDWLLSHGADPNWTTPSVIDMSTGLCTACNRQHAPKQRLCPRVLEITPVMGALDYFSHVSFGGSLLEGEESRVRLLKSLFDHGVDVNQQFPWINCPHTDIHLRCLTDPRYTNNETQHWNPLGLALFTQPVGPQTVKFLLDSGARFEMGEESLLVPVIRHMPRCVTACAPSRLAVNLPFYDCHSKARVLMSRHPFHEGCSCIPSFDSMNSYGLPDLSPPHVLAAIMPYGGSRLEDVFKFLSEYRLPILSSELDSGWSKMVTPLFKALRSSNPVAVRLLIESGADPNARITADHTPGRLFNTLYKREYVGQTALSYVVAQSLDKRHEMILQLLESGADPNGTTAEGIAPLHILGQRQQDVATANLLLHYGANVNAKNPYGWSPLHFACWSAKMAIPNSNVQPIQRILHGRRISFISALVGAGADLQAATFSLDQGEHARGDIAMFSGKTPFQMALHFGNRKLARYLAQLESVPGDG